MKVLIPLLLLTFSVSALAQQGYNGVPKDAYETKAKVFLTAFKKQNFDIMKSLIIPDSLKSARNNFSSTIKDATNDGIDWTKVEFVKLVTYNGLMTGDNPTRFDIKMVDDMIIELKSKGTYEVTVWAVCKFENKLFEIQLGTFNESMPSSLSDGEFDYSDEPIE